VLFNRIRQTAAEVHGRVSGDDPCRFNLHALKEFPHSLQRSPVLHGETHQPGQAIIQGYDLGAAIVSSDTKKQF
jgi:hypothetical protein